MKEILYLKLTFILLLFYMIVILRNPKSTVSLKRMDCYWKTDYKGIIVVGNQKNSLNDLVELLEEEKQTIDEKLQSVEKNPQVRKRENKTSCSEWGLEIRNSASFWKPWSIGE